MYLNVVFGADAKHKKSNLEKKIYFYERRPKRRWTKLSKFYVLITKAKKFYSGTIPKYIQSLLSRIISGVAIVWVSNFSGQTTENH